MLDVPRPFDQAISFALNDETEYLVLADAFVKLKAKKEIRKKSNSGDLGAPVDRVNRITMLQLPK